MKLAWMPTGPLGASTCFLLDSILKAAVWRQGHVVIFCAKLHFVAISQSRLRFSFVLRHYGDAFYIPNNIELMWEFIFSRTTRLAVHLFIIFLPSLETTLGYSSCFQAASNVLWWCRENPKPPHLTWKQQFAFPFFIWHRLFTALVFSQSWWQQETSRCESLSLARTFPVKLPTVSHYCWNISAERKILGSLWLRLKKQSFPDTSAMSSI